MHPSSVDLPAPFGPIRQVSDPAAIASETSSTALTAPNDLVTPTSSHAVASTGRAATEAGATESQAT